MAVNDHVTSINTISPDSYIYLKPSSGTEIWVIRNIIVNLGASVGLYYTDTISTDPDLLITKIGSSLLDADFYCSADGFLALHNFGTTSVKVAYDGVVIRA